MEMKDTAPEIPNGVDDYHIPPQINPKDWRKVCRDGLIKNLSLVDDSGAPICLDALNH